MPPRADENPPDYRPYPAMERSWAPQAARDQDLPRTAEPTRTGRAPEYQPAEPPEYQSAEPPEYWPAEPPEYQSAEPPEYRPAEPPGYRPVEPPEYRSAEAPEYRPAEPPGYRSAEPPGYRPAEAPGYQSAEAPEYRSVEPPEYRPVEPPGYWSVEPPGYRSVEAPGYRPAEPPEYRPAEPPGYRPVEAPEYRSAEPPEYRSVEPPEYRSVEPPEYRPVEAPDVAVGTDLPDGLYDTRRADPRDRQDAIPSAPEWLQTPGELPTVAGTGFLYAGEEPQPEMLDSFPPPGRRRRNRLLVAATVTAAAVLAAVALFVTRHPGGQPDGTPRPVPAGSRATDANPSSARSTRSVHSPQASPRQIATGQLFPHAQVTADSIRFRRVTPVLNQKCSAAARAAFAAALKSAGCQRVIRATFVDTASRYAVTAGVAELPSPAAASRADRSRKFGQDVWFVGLDGPAKSGATELSRSVGVGYDTVYGQYIVYALATNSDGRNPTGHAAQVQTLKALAHSFTAVAGQPLTGPAR